VAEGERLICASSALADGGRGLRFEVEWQGCLVPAFVIRYRGRVHAYLNRCGHVPVELDWNEGEFFDISGLYLICATHGALYAPGTGACVGGRCNGRGLQSLPVAERDGNVYLMQEGN
jgi:nitrite reductase/ring-hydroxylating ferredoxin subunit